MALLRGVVEAALPPWFRPLPKVDASYYWALLTYPEDIPLAMSWTGVSKRFSLSTSMDTWV